SRGAANSKSRAVTSPQATINQAWLVSGRLQHWRPWQFVPIEGEGGPEVLSRSAKPLHSKGRKSVTQEYVPTTGARSFGNSTVLADAQDHKRGEAWESCYVRHVESAVGLELREAFSDNAR